jgi:hypothetical protein
MIKPVRIKYLVSSHVGYYKKTLPIILPSLIRQVGTKNVLVTIGGGNESDQIMEVETHWVPHNSFEYSSLIDFVESNKCECGYEFVFLLHDTMICGEKFSELSGKVNVFSDVTMAHEKGWCNLGAFKVSFLISIKDSLIAMKNISKKMAIGIEGKFFGKYSTYANPSADLLKDFCESPYGGSERCVCKFNSVDVIKYGSNDSARFQSGIVNENL